MGCIIVTGGNGFIGSNLVRFLNAKGYDNIVVVDTLERKDSFKLLIGAKFIDFIDYKKGIDHIYRSVEKYEVDTIFHIGANADVLIDNCNIMLEENFEHSKFWLSVAERKLAHFIYASSSAVYGNSKCFRTCHDCEIPHNEYAFSKLVFDNYIRYKLNMRNDYIKNYKVIGFRLFNTFGIGESHKGKNASITYRFYKFISEREFIDLFEGNIQRDYVWVNDVCEVVYKSWKENIIDSGIYNLGSGDPISHYEVAKIAIETMQEEGKIKHHSDFTEYIRLIPIPNEIKDKFQYFTKADDLPLWIKEITKNNRLKIKDYIKELCRTEN